VKEPKPYCDLIMKGGITSGVAYPGAVLKLHEKYNFAAIGGASAGAIAAGMTAAAQYASEHGGFTRLGALRTELRQPGLLLRLFRATKETRPLLDLLAAGGTPMSTKIRLLAKVLSRLGLPLLIWLSVGFAVIAMLLGHAGATWHTFTWVSWVALGVLLALGAAVSFAGIVAVRLRRAVTAYLPSSFYGMCLGVSENDNDASGPALTEWLHEWTQRVAGKPGDAPLTFADLHERDVELQLITTDIALTRPVRFSRRDPAGRDYLFDVDEFRALFPEPIVEHLTGDQKPVAGNLYRLPRAELPIVVAVRMSLSFPVLLAAVPLWTIDPERGPARHWISDGGISSNFPIHYFDSWVPGRPTFGLNLVPTDRDRTAGDKAANYVRMYPDRPPLPRPVPIGSLSAFLRQIISTMQNWRDTLQSELTGFHDRIAHIELTRGEGGMNIAMDTKTIDFIGRKGDHAGEQLRTRFNWEQHQINRYHVFMGLLQDGLSPETAALDRRLRTFRDAWDTGLSERFAERAANGHPKAAWYAAAGKATGDLFAGADEWLDTFRSPHPLVPPAGMRITPDE
jgi:predicted acylesterase/phospholipase RssA